jgi:S1-C subfamily serine protease
VVPSSPADKAGIVENDIILEVNGEKVDESNGLVKLIQEYHVGDTIDLKILSKGKEKTVKVKLEEGK